MTEISEILQTVNSDGQDFGDKPSEVILQFLKYPVRLRISVILSRGRPDSDDSKLLECNER